MAAMDSKEEECLSYASLSLSLSLSFSLPPLPHLTFTSPQFLSYPLLYHLSK